LSKWHVVHFSVFEYIEVKMNRFLNKRLMAMALTFVISMALVRLPLTAARERKGSTVEVTMADGRVVKGELLAVKSNALLVYDRDAGRGESLDLLQVAQVKVLKKSKLLLGLAIGLGAGLGFCAVNGFEDHTDEGMRSNFFKVMSLAGLCGGLLGACAGLSDKFSPAGSTPQDLQRNLERLKRYAREKDLEISAPPVSVEGMSSHPDESHGPRQHRHPPHRFRLLWAPGFQFSSGNIDYSDENGTFQFVENATPENATVYRFKLIPHYDLNHLKIGQLRLEYELTPHFSSSLEFFARGGAFTDYMDGTLGYYSTEPAGRYVSTIFVNNDYAYSSLLLGLNWKPFLSSFACRHVAEFGIAVGPARAQVNLDNSYGEDPARVAKFKTWTGSCKVHAAYDYFYNDNFSLGVFVAYQYLRPSFPSFTFFNKEQPFRPEYAYNSAPFTFTRPTEYTIPGRRIQLGGMALGLRAGLRF
jgi:hypothetical protein